MNTAAEHGPEVQSARKNLARVPPPLAFALAVAGGLALDRSMPLAIVPGSARGIAQVAGIALMGLGLGLAVSCLVLFLRRSTTIVPHRSATALVTGGPYRLTRNPMYVGLTLICAGAAAFANALWPLLLLPAPLLLVATIHIPFEEAVLRAAFGEEYRRYASRVRRWL